MNHSIHSADRSTHLKIVVVALVAGIAVAAFGIAQATDYARTPLLPAVDHQADLDAVARSTWCGDLRRTHVLSYQVWKQAVKKRDAAGDAANEAMMRATLERLAALEAEGVCGG